MTVLCLVLAALASGPASALEALTPLLLEVADPPMPFPGSDGRIHLVYELKMTNVSSGDIAVESVAVLGNGVDLESLDGTAVAGRLQPAGLRQSTGVLAKSTMALLFLHVAMEPGQDVPRTLSHRVSIRASAAPAGAQELTETGGTVAVDRAIPVLIGPPLSGERYIAADACCDAVRHTRAALPVNGRVWVAQRFAVDWEQLDEQGCIYAGPKDRLESYAIYGRPVLAVADATVAAVTDGQPQQTPGRYPTDLPLEAADGNAVILDLGSGRYALYAHLQPGSLRVRPGDRVTTGQVLGLVGDSGNSVVPHLHFQVMDAPASLAANGLPYRISRFAVTGRTAGTDAFDEAEDKGSPLAISALSPPHAVTNAMPLDQLIVAFAPRH
jgi:hypothetical protein